MVNRRFERAPQGGRIYPKHLTLAPNGSPILPNAGDPQEGCV